MCAIDVYGSGVSNYYTWFTHYGVRPAIRLNIKPEEPPKYTATLMVDGEVFTTIEYSEGQKSIDLPEVPKKEGFTGTWENYSLLSGGTTINAVYTENPYKVRWIVDNQIIDENIVLFGKSIPKPSDPAKEGYSFIGWAPEIPSVMPAHDLAFVAQFEMKHVPDLGRVRSVKVSNMTLSYKSDGFIQPNITIDSGVSYTVEYSDYNRSIISVNESGAVHAAKKGSTDITCIVIDEYGNSAVCTFNVTVKYTWWQILIRIFLLGFIWY